MCFVHYVWKTLDKYEQSAIADVLEPEYFVAGKEIIIEGTPGDKFYFLEEGTAEARTRGAVVMKYGKGDYFGELALLNDEPRSATVLAVTDCKVVSIDSESFKVCSCKCHTGCKERLR
jgi:cAMP-dependent protein kinase regulator